MSNFKVRQSGIWYQKGALLTKVTTVNKAVKMFDDLHAESLKQESQTLQGRPAAVISAADVSKRNRSSIHFIHEAVRTGLIERPGFGLYSFPNGRVSHLQAAEVIMSLYEQQQRLSAIREKKPKRQAVAVIPAEPSPQLQRQPATVRQPDAPALTLASWPTLAKSGELFTEALLVVLVRHGVEAGRLQSCCEAIKNLL